VWIARVFKTNKRHALLLQRDKQTMVHYRRFSRRRSSESARARAETGSTLTPRVHSADWSRGSSRSRFRLSADPGRIAHRGDHEITNIAKEFRLLLRQILRDIMHFPRVRSVGFSLPNAIADRSGEEETGTRGLTARLSRFGQSPVNFCASRRSRLSAESGCGFSATND